MAAEMTAQVDAPKTLFNLDFSFLSQTSFYKKSAQEGQQIQELNANIYSLRLSYLFKSQNKHIKNLLKKEFALKRARDLIHSISALYDQCLPDIGPSTIYDCICAPKSFTICIFKSNDDHSQLDDDNQSVYESNDCLSSLEEAKLEEPSIFHDIFSDMEKSDDDDDESSQEETSSDNQDESDQDDFTRGLGKFLSENSKSHGSTSKIPLLKNLIGLATIQRNNTYQLPGQEEHVVDLQLMCVRKRYRGYNMGKYLISLIQNRRYVGTYDAIVTSSDVFATKFYEKYGFTTDPILNSKYAHIGDIWTNTTKMCFVPPYCLLTSRNKETSSLSVLVEYVYPIEKYLVNKKEERKYDPSQLNDNFDSLEDTVFIHEISNMERDFKRWQKIMFSSYQYQSQLFGKFKQEIIALKAKLCAKDGIIDDLKIQNNMLINKNKFLKLQLDNLTSSEDNKVSNEKEDIYELISKLESINNQIKQ